MIIGTFADSAGAFFSVARYKADRRSRRRSGWMTRSKLTVGSPPWNSILIVFDGLRNVASRARAACFHCMSKDAASTERLDTWQYWQACSQRSVTTKMSEKIKCERAQVEGVIGNLKSKKYGFNKPNVKSTSAMIMAGHRSCLGFNLCKALRLLNQLEVFPA